MDDVDTINYTACISLYVSFHSTSPCNMFRPLHLAIVRQMVYLWPSIIRQVTVYETIMTHLTYSYREVT
jgi:hypothetical protein